MPHSPISDDEFRRRVQEVKDVTQRLGRTPSIDWHGVIKELGDEGQEVRELEARPATSPTSPTSTSPASSAGPARPTRPVLIPDSRVSEPWLPEWCWARYPMLEHIRQAAFSKGLSPTALLRVGLLRLACFVPPHVVLPGPPHQASLNSLLLVQGPSGVGKSASLKAATDLLCPGVHFSHRVGSGEGLAQLFWKVDDSASPVGAMLTASKGPKAKGGRVRSYLPVLVEVHEADELLALAARNRGSTWVHQILQGFMGERIGFENATAERTTPCEPHSYRMSVVIAAQDTPTAELFRQDNLGFPQRLNFALAVAPEPGTPDRWHRPAHPGALGWDVRRMPRLGAPPWEAGDLVELDVPPALRRWAVDQFEDRREAAGRGEQLDDLDAHAALRRLKDAALLSILLENHWEVSEDVWPIALELGRASDAARALAQAKSQVTEAHIDANREQRIAAARYDGTQAFVATRIPLDGARAARHVWKYRPAIEGGVVEMGADMLKHVMSAGARRRDGWGQEALIYACVERWLEAYPVRITNSRGESVLTKREAFRPGPVRPPEADE
jgi:hypothetical protein